MFRVSHFVAAISCAIVFVAVNPEHSPYVKARLEALQAVADAADATQTAAKTIRLHDGPDRVDGLTASFEGGEWVVREDRP